MSQHHIALVRRSFEALNERDVDRALAEMSEEFVMDWSNSIGPAKGVYRGRDQILEVWTSFLEAFESVVWEPREFIEVDDSRLIVINRTRLRGRGSGVEVGGVGAHLWTFRDGEAQSFKLYQSKAEVLQAVESPSS